MRRYLPAELRRRFDIAWKMLPEDVSDRLRRYIADVRSVESLKGASVRLKAGALVVSEDEGDGWFVPDEAAGRGFIRLREGLQDDPDEVPAVFTVLHECAHALEYLEDDWRAGARWPDRSETAACAQAMAWAARDASKPYAGGYERASSVALLALLYAEHEWKAWRRRERGLNEPGEVEEAQEIVAEPAGVAADPIADFRQALAEVFSKALGVNLEPKRVVEAQD